jgi:hypothetical protein
MAKPADKSPSNLKLVSFEAITLSPPIVTELAGGRDCKCKLMQEKH